MRRCSHCGEGFSPKSDEQRFCRKTHGDKYRKAAKIAAGQPFNTRVDTEAYPNRDCLWCETPFAPTAPDQVFCRKLHATKANLARQRLRSRECPRPDKMSHATRGPADARVAGLARVKGFNDLESYLCRCGLWHVGHVLDEAMVASRQRGARVMVSAAA